MKAVTATAVFFAKGSLRKKGTAKSGHLLLLFDKAKTNPRQNSCKITNNKNNIFAKEKHLVSQRSAYRKSFKNLNN